MTQIEYQLHPADLRPMIEPLLEKWKFLIPTWCHRLTVLWKDDAEDATMTMEAHYEYRRAELTILSPFITRPDLRETHVIHELLHIALAPMDYVMIDMRNFIKEHHPEMEKWVTESIEAGNEATVCDLTQAIRCQLHQR